MASASLVYNANVRAINTSCPSFSTDEKSKSGSPARTVFRAKRREPIERLLMDDEEHSDVHSALPDPDPEHDAMFAGMSDEQYQAYQQQSMPQRMKRKRTFDVFSSGSNDALHSILQSASPFRVAYHCMFYARVNNCNQNKPNENENPNESNNNKARHDNVAQCEDEKQAAAPPRNAFDLLIHSSKRMQDWNAAAIHLKQDDDDDDDTEMHHISRNDGDNDDGGDCDAAIQALMAQTVRVGDSRVIHPVFEECPITRLVRVQSEWVQAYLRYEDADHSAWRQQHRSGKIHEYQINRAHGVILLDLNSNASESEQQPPQQQHLTDAFIQQHEADIKQWVLDHGYSGFIWKECYCLYQPHLYWNLVDDHKTHKVKQTLISDMFKSSKTSPIKNAWKNTFSM